MISILATTDGSPESLAVIPAIELLASTGAARVELLTVLERPASTQSNPAMVRAPVSPMSGVPSAPASVTGRRSAPPEPSFVESDGQAIDRAQAEAHELLETIAAPLRERGMAVATAVLMNSSPAFAIANHAREGGFDLIAMATHGRSGLRQLVQGSVASAVLKSGVAPVVLVPPATS